MVRIYCASGWFTENTEKSLSEIENLLKNTEYVEPYFPRHDGIKLSKDDFHDHKLRKRVFQENVSQIKSSDFLVVNLDGSDGFYDTGTCWELGCAMANDIPIIAYDPKNMTNKFFEGINYSFFAECNSISSLKNTLEIITKSYLEDSINYAPKMKLLFVGPDTTEEQRKINMDIISNVILESHGSNFRSLDNLNHEELSSSIDDIFEDIDYMVAVIDDRHPIVSWMMGQAYERGIPIISYTNFDYGVNLMLSISILTHCKGQEELKTVLQHIKREGLFSFHEYDTSKLRVY